MTAPDLRQKIFEAALAVCAERGYHATRIDEIVKRAGVSKGGLYHHFKSKRDLFAQLSDVLVEGTIEQAGALEAQVTTEQALHQLFAAFDAWLQDERMVRGLIELYVVGLSDPPLGARLAASYQALLRFGVGLIERGRARGEIDPGLDPERVAMALFPGADGIVFMHLVAGSFERAHQALRDYETLLVRALRPPTAAGGSDQS